MLAEIATELFSGFQLQHRLSVRRGELVDLLLVYLGNTRGLARKAFSMPASASSTHCWVSEGFRSNSRAGSDALVLSRIMPLKSAALHLAVQRLTSLFSRIVYVLVQATTRCAGIQWVNTPEAWAMRAPLLF